MKRVYDFDKDTLLALLEQGLKVYEIAKHLGVSYSTVERRAKEHGIWAHEYTRTHRRKLTKEVLVAALEEGGVVAAAQKLKVSRGTILRYTKAHGICAKAYRAKRIYNRKQQYRENLYSVEGANPQATSGTIKSHFYKQVKPECSICQQGEVWNGRPMVLQMDHIDGDRNNNRLSNLRLLCPNCHSQTPTFGSRNRKTKSYLPRRRST